MTLYDALVSRCDSDTDQRFVFPDEGITLSAVELVTKADALAGGLQALDLAPSSVVLLCSHNSSTLVAAFLAVQRVGLVPSLVAPSEKESNAFRLRLPRHVGLVHPSAVLLDESHDPDELEFLRQNTGCVPGAGPLIRYFHEIPSGCSFHDVERANLSFVQFTSGSVLDPKGVLISHANVEANCFGMAACHDWSAEDTCICWLPLYHDMGLVGHFAASCLVGWSLVLVDPSTFVRNPAKWLRLITDYRGTASGAPNFAYAVCATRIPDRHLDGLDLSTWRNAYNGSEPIRRKEIQAFIERFQKFGFSQCAMKNVYGLAESTLAATFPPKSCRVKYLTADAEYLTGTNRYHPASSETNGIDCVSVGRPLVGHDLQIIQPETGLECNEGEIGEIRLRGPSVMVDYAGAASAVQDGWLRTGDMGFIWKKDLYVTGRMKDVIKKGGKNIFAADVETLSIMPRLVRAAAAFEYDVGSRAKLGLAIEINPTADSDPTCIVATVRQNVLSMLSVSLDSIWIVPHRAIPKTTSGKVQRTKSAELALSGVWGPPVEAMSRHIESESQTSS